MDRYEIIQGAVGAETLKLVKDSLVISKDAAYHLEGVPFEDTKRFGDPQCPDSFVSYGHPVCEALLLSLGPRLERVTGKSLLPTYSYGRIYWKGAILEKHKARESCQYSATLCVDAAPDPWPIFMDGNELILEPGDMVCYKGMEVEHWREPYRGQQQIQVFLHFVDKNGIYADRLYDGRPCLGFDRTMPPAKAREWAQAALALQEQARVGCRKPD